LREIEAAKREEAGISEDEPEAATAVSEAQAAAGGEAEEKPAVPLTEEERRRRIAELAISWDTRMEESKRKHKVPQHYSIFQCWGSVITCPQAHHLQFKKLNFLLKFCVKILFCKHYFSPLNTFMRKGKDPDPDPYLWLMDSNPDPGGPKTSGSPTLEFSCNHKYRYLFVVMLEMGVRTRETGCFF
jgi:hypothetical protein